MIIYYFALKQKSQHKILLFHPSYNESMKIILLHITNKKQLKKGVPLIHPLKCKDKQN